MKRFLLPFLLAIASGVAMAQAAPDATAAVADAAPAAAELVLDRGDTAFMLASAALVLLMTPALAFFYGGLSRSKSVLNTMMMSVTAMGIVTLTWVVVGFSIAFGDEPMGAYFGSFAFGNLFATVFYPCNKLGVVRQILGNLKFYFKSLEECFNHIQFIVIRRVCNQNILSFHIVKN